MTIWTIGHSTRLLPELIDLLSAWEVTRLADVRSIPRSHRNPQFNADTLPAQLASAGIDYVHFKALGGFRRPRRDSPNNGWKSPGFRGYADYMQTESFAQALESLITLAHERLTAIMCAESVPWRCHRSLIADTLTVRGHEVRHIMDAKRADPHRLTSFARVEGTRITYPLN